MNDQFGPEAKKIVDEMWKQVQDILKVEMLALGQQTSCGG
jgi:hypothetical protein